MGRSHFSPADGPLMLRRVLEDPADDAPRLTYADWLEEAGKEERAEFIRLQIAGHDFTTDEWGRWCDVALEKWWFPFSEHVSAKWERGFVSEIRLTCEQFMAHAEHLFREHPITKVVLMDRKPAIPYTSYFEWYKDRGRGKWTRAEFPYHLPDEIFDRINAEQRQLGNIVYYTLDSLQFNASKLLSDACVSLGRKLAGLPPLPQVQTSVP